MNILIVAPYFPPYPSVAVVRIKSLTSYLIKSGYKITVLTNKNTYKNANEIEFNDPEFKNINKVEVDISNGNGRYFANRDIYLESFHNVMKNNKFDCVLITCGPYYTLPICKVSKLEYNTKCIIDFRDLWIFDIRSIKRFLSPSSLLRKVVFFPIEKEAIKYADKVITVTDGWGKILKRIYPKYRGKIEVIYNGYDNQYSKNNKIPANETSDYIEKLERNVKIMSFGKLSYYSRKYSLIFFKAIKDMLSIYPSIKVIQIGNEEEETNEIIDKVNFNKDNFINTGFCDYRNGMSLLSYADVCILIDIRKKAIGTKIYDYIYQNKPIIYIGKKNTLLSNFVSSFENGFSCQTENQVKQALAYIIENRIDYLTTNNDYKKYSREVQNKRYINIIEDVVEG